ncbi:hypothetical protein BS50DRAFT_509359 [Corynespora cassiicola Philippines]|uniref:Uncharacterized protein n=1 Tax=Corynespora cassiicola Philippines TaxID=1448308 RepID=A0A2T2N0Q3_CORCC|nr:hypothetical protein BS50DRAFT_509359 [Corynespora cassiicola Philippines]
MTDNTFFGKFPGFEPDPSAPVSNEFFRLARHMRWRPGSKRFSKMRAECFRSEFAVYFGNDASRLQNWQSLCLELGIRENIGSITQCRKKLSRVHVNIVDLIDGRRTGDEPPMFPSMKALRRYTRSMGKFFPKEEAKAEGFLKALLRKVL